MRYISTATVGTCLLLFLTTAPLQAQEDGDAQLLDRYSYELASSSPSGPNGTKYNYVVDTDCKFTERQSIAYAGALADSIDSANDSLRQVTVFLYLEGMNPESVAYADVQYTNGEQSRQNFRDFVARATPRWSDAEKCDWSD